MGEPEADEAEAGGPATAGRPRFYTSPDGLKLHAREYGDPVSPWTPVVCLPGLTRSHRDFREIARHLSGHRHRPRRVICFDYRGRALSDRDEDAGNYNLRTEVGDIFAGMAAFDVPRAVVIGVSRGGLAGMFLGTRRPSALAGLVLVDIGPVVEPLGLARIRSYVGQTPEPNDWADAAGILRRIHGPRFTAWSDDDWDDYARLTFREEDGKPVADYDLKLAETLGGIEFDRPLPDMWAEFDTLADVPMMVVRGEHSDLLSPETVAAMAERHAGLEIVEVPGEGHPPRLRGGPLLNRISAFITAVEGNQLPPDAVLPVELPDFDLDAKAEN